MITNALSKGTSPFNPPNCKFSFRIRKDLRRLRNMNVHLNQSTLFNAVVVELVAWTVTAVTCSGRMNFTMRWRKMSPAKAPRRGCSSDASSTRPPAGSPSPVKERRPNTVSRSTSFLSVPNVSHTYVAILAGFFPTNRSLGSLQIQFYLQIFHTINLTFRFIHDDSIILLWIQYKILALL